MDIINNIVLDLCHNDFLLPYLRRELEYEDAQSESVPNCAVRVLTQSCQIADDQEFNSYCQKYDIPIAKILCPLVIGTNMNGLPRRIAAGISRGTFVNIKDNKAQVSVVHATDIARAVKLIAGTHGSFTFHDGYNPLISQLAEALAYRFQDKRLLSIKPRWAKLWYGSEYFHELATNHLLENSFLETFPDFQPNNTIQYLRTHVYDENSL